MAQTLFSRLFLGFRMALHAFRESALVDNLYTSEEFSDFETRKIRYAVYWAMYENTVYSDVHTWAKLFKSQFGLYRFIRSIYTPASELIDFWKTHIFGGVLDTEAGDGTLESSAIPIALKGAADESLRDAISLVWQNSRWEDNKDVYTGWGASLGDVFLKPVVSPDDGLAYMKVVHPGFVKNAEVTDQGKILSYEIEMPMRDPEHPQRMAKYNEVVTMEGDSVKYTTFKDGKEYGWYGPATWTYEYGFVPLVKVQHINVGEPWGWSEMHKHRTKFFEVDDMASIMHDQIRKVVNPLWLFKGMSAPKSTAVTMTHTDPTLSNPQADREKLPAIYAGEKADAKALTVDLNLDDVSTEILNTLKAIESAYPELRKEVQNVGGEASGKAIREMRRMAESKVRRRRVAYNNGLVDAHKMTIALAGFHSIPGFEDYKLEDYHDKGSKLSHAIGDHSVFETDPLDEVEKAFWQAANEAERAGVSLPFYLERAGWSEENISKVTDALAYRAKESSLEALIAMNEAAIANPMTNPSAISQNGPVAGLNKNQLRPKVQNQVDKVSEPEFTERDEDGTRKETVQKRTSVTKE